MKKYLVALLLLVLSCSAFSVSFLTAGHAHAASWHTVTLRGGVSCTNHSVAGIWVQSTSGDSHFANWLASPNDSWDAVYWTTVNIYYGANVSLHVGCNKLPGGGWGSDNPTPDHYITNNTMLSASCDENNAHSCTFGTIQQGVSAGQQGAITVAKTYLGKDAYYHLCTQFVFDMYKTADNIDLRQWVGIHINGGTFAADVWHNIIKGDGLLGYDKYPPAGALVFYIPASGLSHVTLSVGWGLQISTADSVNGVIHYETIDQHTQASGSNSYVGWWLPA